MSVIDASTADRTARQWLDAWNAHDAAAVVAHFADDVTAASPLIDAWRPESGGRLRGRHSRRRRSRLPRFIVGFFQPFYCTHEI